MPLESVPTFFSGLISVLVRAASALSRSKAGLTEATNASRSRIRIHRGRMPVSAM